MEASEIIKSTSCPVPSPDGLHIASLHNNRLIIRSSTSLSPFRTINVAPSSCDKNATLRWCRPTATQPWCYRILLYTPEWVKVWDLRNAKWVAAINNGSGGMGKVANAEFGFDMDEVLVWSEFSSKATVWSLVTSRNIEIKDPKFITVKGCAFRPEAQGRTRVCALLSRPSAQDTLTLHAPRSWKVLRTVTLPTHDAQGVKWSADGRWLAIWDSASVGTRVCIFTADGYLYRVYKGDVAPDQELQLGVKSIEWSPCGRYLIIGGYGRKATVLSTRTFAPEMYLEHTTSVHIAEGQVWQETVSANSKREYTSLHQPVAPPMAVSSTAADLSKTGVSMLAFNSDGTLLATRDDAVPTAVWIWDLTMLKPRTVLLQHSQVKRLTWHASKLGLLLIQCAHDEPTIYLWASLSDSPMILSAPLPKSTSRVEVLWQPSKQDSKPAILISDREYFAAIWPDGRDAVEDSQTEEHMLEDEEDVDQSFDSVVEMLAGRTPLPATLDAAAFEQTMAEVEDGYTTGSFEDTFRGKRPLGVA